MTQELRRTPFHGLHVRQGGKMVPFAGWEMPVQFPRGILQEHHQVRRAAGLFDVAHMGRLHFRGPGGFDYADRLITNSLKKIGSGQLLYSALCNDAGGIIDDVTAYHLGDEVMLVVNASNRENVWRWATAHKPAGVDMIDRTDELAQIALQGPRAEALLGEPFAAAVAGLGYYHFAQVEWRGTPVRISRNGYTGEDGFEIYVPRDQAVALWEQLLAWGRDVDLQPIGLGARDSLRMEVGYMLYGNELSLDTTPLEAGLKWVVKFKDNDFFGREALLKQKETGLERTLIGFEVEGKRLPRHGYAIHHDSRPVGVVTSGGLCPSVGKAMGLGFVPPDLAAVGTRLAIDARGTSLPATVVERPFYKEGSVKR
jgi:aminomethyltransferase